MSQYWMPYLLVAGIVLGVIVDVFANYRRTVITVGVLGAFAISIAILFILVDGVIPEPPTTHINRMRNNILAMLLFSLGVAMTGMMICIGASLSKAVRESPTT